MTAMPATNKFLKYSIYAILVMLIVLIGLSIAQLVLDATQGGGPSMDEMCDYFPPGMCGPPAGGNGTNSSTPAPTQDQHVPQYEINDSEGYNQVALQFLTSVNFSVDPCEDFYAFACGQWPTQHSSPAHSASWSEYALVDLQVSEAIKKAIENIDVNTVSEGALKARHFYDTCMDTKSIQENKGKVLGKLLHTGIPEDPSLFGFENGTGRWPLIDKDYVDASTVSLEAQIGRLKSRFGIDTFWLPYALQYSLNSGQVILWLTPSMLPLGLGMFQQPYYLNPQYKYVMDAYSELQKEVALQLAADSGFGTVNLSSSDLEGMLNLEIDLANLTNFYVNDIEIQKPKSARDYNQDLWNLQTIQQKIPGIKWADYLQNLVSDDLWHKISVGNEAVINADSPDYFDSLAQLLQKYRPRDIRNYAIWRLIKYSLPYMSSEYTAALAKFNSVLYGKNVTATPQADVCLSYLKGNYELPNLGFATAEAMLARGYFSVKAKNRAVEMFGQVKSGLTDLITASTWMDAETKAAALFKVKLMDSSIAYPDWILNKTAQQAYYKDLQIPSASFISLNLMLRGWAVRKQLTEVAVPLDRGAFPGTPMATDAWYTASTNSLTVPLGELQSPFFGLDFPDAVNFGGAGAVVGHECSHGFDENGAMFNAYGNETNWWTDSSKRAFEDHCNCLINQFNHYCYPNNIGCVNGNQTIDENVADLAGIKAAFKAYKKQSTPQYRLAKAPMFSDDQLFFLSFASFWCGKDTDGAIQQQLQTDVHTPKKFRVIGTLRNVPEFSQAFQCSDSSYMNPKEKCSIW